MKNQYFAVYSAKDFMKAKKAYASRGFKLIALTDVIATFVKGDEKVTVIYKYC